MITKKDLIGLAKILNNHILGVEFNKLEFLEDLYLFLESSNPNFDKIKFRQAIFKKVEKLKNE